VVDASQETIWNVPNLLTLSRLPLSAVLFVCISAEAWFACVVVFLIASLTDALDGWWARKFNQFTAFGRVFDPLIDKIMVGGAFIYLIQVPASGLLPWMVTVVIGRELLITGVRGYVESLGKKFGADWFGKLKMILQCVTLGAIFAILWVRPMAWARDYLGTLDLIQMGLIYAMLAATIGSGVQYCWRAAKLLQSKN
jgi:CDP-diacylglycerol--glycerol-3-phosphate 3-phosphatidyltransferase